MSTARLPPPVTITIPGQPSTAAQPLATQPAPSGHGRRGVVAAIASVGLVGTLVGTSAVTDPVPLPSSAQGVTAGATLTGRPVRGATSLRLDVQVQIGAGTSVRDAERLTVVGVAGKGLAVVLAGEPSVHVEREGGRLQLGVDVRIDCSGTPSGPRSLALVVRRGSRQEAEVPVQNDVGVDLFLNRIAARTCPPPGEALADHRGAVPGLP